MIAKRYLPARLLRLLPRSTFLRFMLAAVLVLMLTASTGLLVSYLMGRSMVHNLYEEACSDSLRSAADLVGRYRSQQEEFRNHLLSSYRLTLDSALDGAATLTAALDTSSSGDLHPESASKIMLDYIDTAQTLSHVRIMAVSRAGIIVVHPDPAQTGRLVSELPQIGETASEVFESLQSQLPGVTEFASCEVLNATDGKLMWFIAGRQFRTWGLTFFAMLPETPMEQQLAVRWESNLDELRARIREIIIARSGFVFIFNEDCEVVSHPIRLAANITDVQVPGGDLGMCDELKQAALLPWGENRLRYRWNRPDKQDRFDFDKITWVTVEPTTGWYVAACVYVDDIEADLPLFVGRIFFPALVLIMLTIFALALLLKRLLTPVKDLTHACQKAAQGDFSVQARETDTGDMGFLVRQFNMMIRSIGELRETDARNRQELHHLNTNLERMVSLRTRALESKARKLEIANARLRELDQLKSDFLSSVSHELRTPMTSILGFSKLIRRVFRKRILGNLEGRDDLNHAGQRIDRNLEIIAQEGDRLTRLINDVLDLSRIEAGRMPWREENVNLEELIRESVKVLEPLTEEGPRPDVRVRITPGLPAIRTDRDRFLQVLINLIDNAVKFTPDGNVSISACCREQTIQILVRDTGRGILRKDLWTIFDSFHQSIDDTRDVKPPGTGLGLAICRAVITRYGGLIWAESTPGQGAELYLEFPIEPADPAD